MSLMRFIKFILTEIFPGGQLPQVSQIEEHATKVGFNVTRVQALRPHYVRTLSDLGGKSGGPQGRGDRDHLRRGLRAVHEVSDRLRRPVRDGYTDVCQFTCEKT